MVIDIIPAAEYVWKTPPVFHRSTGVIEGTCRYVVRDRMESTGARWRWVGVEVILELRALRAGGDFDAYWDFHEAREYERNHAQRYADGIAPPVSEPPPIALLTPPSQGQVALPCCSQPLLDASGPPTKKSRTRRN